jgi:hypothetical protein
MGFPLSKLEFQTGVQNLICLVSQNGVFAHHIDHNFRATGTSEHSIDHCFSKDDKVLAVQGHVFDRVAKIGDIYKGMNIAGTISEIMRSIKSFLKGQRILAGWEAVANVLSVVKYVTGEDIIDAYWQTLITGNIKKD